MKLKLFLALALTFAVTASLFVMSSTDAEEAMGLMDHGSKANYEPSPLFDDLAGEADVIYLLANSSIIFGPDPNGRSEEVTFAGPVTVPKWPMDGYERRILADGRQQIDIELVQSDLTGESYLLGGPIILGEHPDLRSTGTITERPDFRTSLALASDNGRSPTSVADDGTANSADTDVSDEPIPEEVPADFVVRRKVLLTTAKGVLYNETAVPVKGRINSIPPVVFNATPTGVNVFRGMELPVALLDENGQVNGWFYSKAHMAYAVKPSAVQRGTVTGQIAFEVDGQTEQVAVSGPIEIHHGKPANTNDQATPVEVMVMALRGYSELLGGDIMVTEAFSDRDRFSSGKLQWRGESGETQFGLFVDLYTPSAKLSNHESFGLTGMVEGGGQVGAIEKGALRLPLVSTNGTLSSNGRAVLYDEAEQKAAEIVGLELELKARG